MPEVLPAASGRQGRPGRAPAASDWQGQPGRAPAASNRQAIGKQLASSCKIGQP